MKTAQPSATPANPPASSQAVAETYVAQELFKARKSLRRTRITGLLLIGFVGTYMTVISSLMTKFLQPREAAEVAAGMLVRHIQTSGPALARELEREIPLLIRNVPLQVLRHLPACREQIEKSLALEFHGRCAAFGGKLGAEMEELMEVHKEDIKNLLEDGDDRAALRRILPDFERAITGFLDTDSDGRQVKKQIGELAATLAQIEKRVDRLANGADLTAEEQKARRALAMLSRVIENQTSLPVTDQASLAK